ncbi:zinc-dependent MarR family transcriptional regulator [Streptococcus hyointestinalis]|uniref:MarR family transcriptional regulator n=1 Tax=Streptococcus hyointestinalis TaxID=1337 RepID=A0A380K5X7_9STRE|nr:zinc-dependent MarR family transcriptional regulator [Streptococcus hyointestinalis]MDD7356170.1 zinc-dependent MarR family transcriptional regulator [Streptococcus hyointestinalis]MDY4553495.1 zinc-dependent MarR family transcriptional regulator [Streptococcus hyointestinalis]SUN59467.1 MarR family transcriptional regulator [Streptococcus hyointestinalis]
MAIKDELDRLINQIVMSSENQHEFLLGACQSGVELTNTQEHILMLLLDSGRMTNSSLSRELVVSQAAVTKAVKQLLQKQLIESVKDERDGRIVLFELTEAGIPIAKEHRHHHELTLMAYDRLFSDFSEDEQAVIERFMGRVSEIIKE